MLESTRLSEQKAKVQAKLRSERYTFLTGQEDDFQTRQGEIRQMNSQVDELDVAIIEAMKNESDEAAQIMQRNADTSGWTPELRELHSVAQRTTIADYVAAAIESRNVGGAAREYNEHVFGSWNPGDYPLEMLLDRDEIIDMNPVQTQHLQADDEKRTVITGVAGTHGNPTFVDRVLANGEAAYCRATFPVVGPGRHSYPVVTGTTVASTIARNTAETAAGGLTIVDADPDRVQHSYEYAAADELQIPGVANGLASDLRMSLSSGLDNKAIDHLQTTLTAADATSGTTMTSGLLLGAIASVVDGRGARFFNEVRVLAGNTSAGSQTTAYARIGALIAGASLDAVFNLLAGIRASGHMAAAASDQDKIITIKTGPAPPRLIVPVWRRGTLLRDTGRLQLSGQITLTGVMYADVILVNADLHNEFTVDTQ